jgi:hypothetical protein
MATNASYTESERFAREKDAIQPDGRRFDEVIDSFCWDVSTRAERFPTIDGTPFRIIRTRPGLGGCPGLRVLFTVDNDDHRTLHSVEVLEDQTPDPDTLFRD